MEQISIAEEIMKYNVMIQDAKKRYMNNEQVIDGVREFFTELDLQRYVDSCNYEKVEFIKEHCSEEINIEGLDDIDKEMVAKIMKLKAILPEEMHKCIGCPCLENDYPQCENCSFQESCLSGNSPYPNECDENDCFYTFKYLQSKEL